MTVIPKVKIWKFSLSVVDVSGCNTVNITKLCDDNGEQLEVPGTESITKAFAVAAPFIDKADASLRLVGLRIGEVQVQSWERSAT